MCYVGKCSFSKKERIAKRNIKVFKYALIDKGIVYPYFHQTGLIYEVGKEYTSNIVKFNGTGNKLIIENGLHSYNNKLCWSIKKEHVSIHSFLSSPDIEFIRTGLVKLKCHIPKGATYYMNLSGEMVSNKLVVDKIVKL